MHSASLWAVVVLPEAEGPVSITMLRFCSSTSLAAASTRLSYPISQWLIKLFDSEIAR